MVQCASFQSSLFFTVTMEEAYYIHRSHFIVQLVPTAI